MTGNPIADSLAGIGPTCPSCKKPVDVWQCVLNDLVTHGQIGMLPLGPAYTHIQFDLPRHGRSKICLTDHGIPADARILQRTYCGQELSNIFPLECHGGSPNGVPFFDGVISLYGATVPARSGVPSKDVSRQLISITWVPAGADVAGWTSLWTALELFARHDHIGVVIPANTAVELITDRVTTSFLADVPGVAGDHLKAIGGDLTYHHRLNVVLPMIAWLTKSPSLPEELKADLNMLKTLRNQVGHTGRTKQQLDREGAARLVRASLFGFHYVRLVEIAHEKHRRAGHNSNGPG